MLKFKHVEGFVSQVLLVMVTPIAELLNAKWQNEPRIPHIFIIFFFLQLRRTVLPLAANPAIYQICRVPWPSLTILYWR